MLISLIQIVNNSIYGTLGLTVVVAANSLSCCSDTNKMKCSFALLQFILLSNDCIAGCTADIDNLADFPVKVTQGH